ncbi:MAG: ABC transporter permease [Balneolales bacterium]|nr:ABC transporter permease [Balneolales bacterium]
MYLTLSWRNLWRNGKRTLITVSAIVFAVVVAVFMQSVNRGSHEQMIDNMVRFHTGYVQLQDFRFEDEPSLDNSFPFTEEHISRAFEADDRITQVIPRIETFMLAGNDFSTRGAFVLGIDPNKEHAFNQIKDQISEGRFFERGEQGAVVSAGLARRLQLSVGDDIVLLGQGRFGMSASGLYEIKGIMKHPLPDLNNQLVYLPLEEAQYMLSADEHATAVLIGLGNERHSKPVAASLKAVFSDDELITKTWPELMPQLLQLLEFDLIGAYFMSGVLYIVIGFGFFSTILTMTLERVREFGVLLSVGMKRSRLAAVLFIETLMISLLGVLVGMGLAWLLLFYFHLNPIELTGDLAATVIEMGWEPIIPMSFAADQFYQQGIIVFLIAMVVYLFPLIKVMRLNILEASRS